MLVSKFIGSVAPLAVVAMDAKRFLKATANYKKNGKYGAPTHMLYNTIIKHSYLTQFSDIMYMDNTDNNIERQS